MISDTWDFDCSERRDRRHFLRTAAFTGAALSAYATANALASSALACSALAGSELTAPAIKSVAGVVTIYRTGSHTDVLIGKILEGWRQDGGPGPALSLASLYVDQFPQDDLSVKLAEKHGFRLCKTIEEAITLGKDGVAVDGVISIGEHGDYPTNALGQHLYPRKRFFEGITATFAKYGQVVPVFNDKHPGPEWADAAWMAQRARELQVPWMAGSSLPVSYRDPDISIPMGSRIERALAVGYSGLDIYGFHTLEFLQCLIERRRGAETGVRSVQSFATEAIPQLISNGTIRTDLLDAALLCSGTDRKTILDHPDPDGSVFVVEYEDGLVVPVLMLVNQGKAISAAIKVEGGDLQAARVEERPDPKHPHFAYLLKGIEQMFHTGRPAYPVERTLLTAGILDRALTSRHDNGRRLTTPELRIAYTPVDAKHAPHINLN